MKHLTQIPLSLLLAIVVLVGFGCRQLTPEEKLQSLRSQYKAEALSFVVVEPSEEALITEETEVEATGEEIGEEIDVEVAAETEMGGADEADELLEATDVPVNVLVDVLISTTATEYLDGLTLDVYQADAAQEVKDHRRIWVDTSGVIRGPGTQVTLELEEVDYAEGDGFSVEVRSPVPEEERSEYREFEQLEGTG